MSWASEWEKKTFLFRAMSASQARREVYEKRCLFLIGDKQSLLPAAQSVPSLLRPAGPRLRHQRGDGGDCRTMSVCPLIPTFFFFPSATSMSASHQPHRSHKQANVVLLQRKWRVFVTEELEFTTSPRMLYLREGMYMCFFRVNILTSLIIGPIAWNKWNFLSH